MGAVLCIDGPSGAGKGTVSQLVAKRLGFKYLDSGALYRVLAVLANDKGLGLEEIDKLLALARSVDVEFIEDQVFYAGEDISSRIRTEEVGSLASKLAPHQEIREALLEAQRSYSSDTGLVADGRDMGTTVFPQAALKIYLNASAEERARRRFFQLRENDHNSNPENSAKQLMDKEDSDSLRALVEEIKKRDERDSTRDTSPLKPADDAILIDSTSMTIEQVVAEVLKHWHQSIQLG